MMHSLHISNKTIAFFLLFTAGKIILLQQRVFLLSERFSSILPLLVLVSDSGRPWLNLQLEPHEVFQGGLAI